jgi:hypothetical protein
MLVEIKYEISILMSFNIRDQIVPIFVLLQPTISHLGSRNVLFGVFEVFKLLWSAFAHHLPCVTCAM